MAITILVGQYKGSKNNAEMKQIMKAGYIINILMALIIATFIVLNAKTIAGIIGCYYHLWNSRNKRRKN